MAFALDEEALNSPNLKIMDINKPPVKAIGFDNFPKMIYLHPKDKTREHLTKVVANDEELKEAQKQGWRTKPHIPIAPVAHEMDMGEFETKTA